MHPFYYKLQLLNDGKELCGSIVKPAVDRVNAVKQYGSDKYHGVINGGKERVRLSNVFYSTR